jgi:outer membrane protein OmpA-like peptidoglycan-associated protein
VATVYFQMGSTTLHQRAQTLLKYVAHHLASGVTIEIDGYMQNNAPGAKNLDISLKRAYAVAAFLKAQGVKVSISIVDKKFPLTGSTLDSARRAVIYVTA